MPKCHANITTPELKKIFESSFSLSTIRYEVSLSMLLNLLLRSGYKLIDNELLNHTIDSWAEETKVRLAFCAEGMRLMVRNGTHLATCIIDRHKL